MLEWLFGNWPRVLNLMALHLSIAASATILGLLIALIAGVVFVRSPKLTALGLIATGVIFTIPSLTMFIFIPLIIGTKILDPINIVIALSIYAFCLIFGGVVEGLKSTDPATVAAARAMGMGPTRILLSVELPLSVPVVAAATRVAAVSSMSLVSVGALIGVGGLGDLFTEGFQRAYTVPIWWGIILSMALALFADLMIVVGERLLTPWRQKAVNA